MLTSLTEDVFNKDVFNKCPRGPNLYLFCVRLWNAAQFCDNYVKLYFDANT